jgi:hypothetical protein
VTPAWLARAATRSRLAHDSTISNVVTPLYAFGTGNTLATFNGTLATLGSTDISSDITTPALQWAQPAFVAFDPVPEPSSPAILEHVLCGLGAFRRYYGTHSSTSPSG